MKYWLPYVAIAIALVVLILVGSSCHHELEVECNRKGGQLICPYKSGCYCLKGVIE